MRNYWKRLTAMLLALLLTAAPALAWGQKSGAELYSEAENLLAQQNYAEAAEVFSALGNYQDASRLAMYCAAIARGERGSYSLAVSNLQALGDFRDSALLARYYAALSYEAAEQYETARERLQGMELYRDVSTRLLTYPEKILARDYAAADQAERESKLEQALAGFQALTDYQDSAARAEAVQQKIYARDYAAADQAEQNGDYAAAYAGFLALGAYQDSAQRAAAVQEKGDYAKGMELARAGKFEAAYQIFTLLGDYADSREKAYALGVTQFSDVTDLKEGTAAFAFHELWGVINAEENVVSTPYWEAIESFNSFGLARVTKDGLYGYINRRGETVIPCQWARVSGFDAQGLCTVAQKSEDGKQYTFGLMDATGRQITPAQWRTLGKSGNSEWNSRRNRCNISAPAFSDGKIRVQSTEGCYGFLDMEGSLVGEVRWQEIGDFSEGLAWVTESSGKKGYIDAQGQTVIQPQYDDALPFSQGLAAVRAGDKWKYINPQNAMAVPAFFDLALSFSNGTADVFLDGIGWLRIDAAGKLLYFINDEAVAAYQARSIAYEKSQEGKKQGGVQGAAPTAGPAAAGNGALPPEPQNPDEWKDLLRLYCRKIGVEDEAEIALLTEMLMSQIAAGELNYGMIAEALSQ